MVWVQILLTLFGPALADIIKQILGEILPELPLWKRIFAKQKLVSMAKRLVLEAESKGGLKYASAVPPGPLEEFGKFRDELLRDVQKSQASKQMLAATYLRDAGLS